MKTALRFLCWVAGATLLCSQACAQTAKPAETDDVRAYFEVLRSDYNATKIRTLNEVLKLTGPEAEVFWPIYRQYEKEMAVVGDEKLALIREFLQHHENGTLNDKNSSALARKWLKNSQARLDLWKKYHRKLSKAVSPIRAAQFLQVEHQMALFVDLGIASEMPQISPAVTPAPAK
jgi:hypothetical protein